MAAAGNSVIGSERIITKVYFPRLAVPFAAVAAAAVDFLVALGLLGVMMVYYRVARGGNLWAAPFIFGAVMLTASGLGVALAALNVSYRDFRYVIPFLLQVGMFATPTVYMQVADEKSTGVLAALLALNPMTGLIGAFAHPFSAARCRGGAWRFHRFVRWCCLFSGVSIFDVLRIDLRTSFRFSS